MTDAHDTIAYHGCPCLAYLPWWLAGVTYAQMAEADDSLLYHMRTQDGPIVIMTAAEMSFYHFMLFWGFVDGRL